MNRTRRFEVAAAVIALLLLLAIGAADRSQRAGESVPSTYDFGHSGYAALYTFLQRENAGAQRFELPLADLPARATLVAAGDYALDPAFFSSSAAKKFERWVARGGTLVVLGRMFPQTLDALGLPAVHAVNETAALSGCAYRGAQRRVVADFTFAMRARCSQSAGVLLISRNGAVAIVLHHGRGRIVQIVTPEIFDNVHLARAGNAAFAYDLFSSLPPARFDERLHGYEQGRTFAQVLPLPVRIAVAVAAIALLLAIAGANLPFAPPKELQRAGVRDSSEYIASLARLLQRGRCGPDVIRRLAKAASGWRVPSRDDENAGSLLEELRGLAQRREAGNADVLRAGTIFARLRKDYGW